MIKLSFEERTYPPGISCLMLFEVDIIANNAYYLYLPTSMGHYVLEPLAWTTEAGLGDGRAVRRLRYVGGYVL